MWSDLVLRFLLGGCVLSAFALIGDLVKPKSYAGIFSAAPSIALGTLGLAIAKHGSAYAAAEGRSMVIGALALYVYSQIVSLGSVQRKLTIKPALWALASIVRGTGLIVLYLTGSR